MNIHWCHRVSSRFYNCVHGKAYELPCATSLIFDEEVGTCVRPEQASEHAKVCPEKLEKGIEFRHFKQYWHPKPMPWITTNCVTLYHSDDISGFSCPDEKTLGPHGQPLAHPSFPHPLSCQKFITCYFSKDIKELGCMKGQVFNYNTLKCVDPDVGPEDWYVYIFLRVQNKKHVIFIVISVNMSIRYIFI